ncbi:MAG: DUF2341 domain-containing protein [Elusimicrobiota bacterium]
MKDNIKKYYVITSALSLLLFLCDVSFCWWNNDWQYRQKFTVTNSSGVLSDYQIFCSTGLINTSSLVSQAKMRDDLGDIRFVDNDDVTELRYWEDKTSSTTAGFVVKLPNIPNGTKDIYLYYGNSNAVSKSSGAAVFDFYDDFSYYINGSSASPTWMVNEGWSVQNGVFQQKNLGFAPPMAKISDLVVKDFCLKLRYRWDGYYNDSIGIQFRERLSSAYTYRIVIAGNSGSRYEFSKARGAFWSPVVLFATAPYSSIGQIDKWHDLKIIANGPNISSIVDSNLVFNGYDTEYTSGTISVYTTNAYWSIDDIYISKYVNPEPSISLTTSEEKYLLPSTNSNSKVKISPNPFNGSNGDTVITFSGFNSSASIKVHTLKGELVWSKDNTGSSENWDVKNKNGKPVASGVYIFVITDFYGNKQTGKLAIIK